MGKIILIPHQKIINKIHFIRSEKVMLDSDLAELYQVETKVLNQAVKRNNGRFPEDFMFQLTEDEWKNLKSQNVTSKERGGKRKLPYVFTEQGVAMLSGVLNSKVAINVNIQIIRVFTQMRKILMTHKDILVKLEEIEKKFLKQDAHNKKIENEIQMIFQALKKLLSPAQKPHKKIGYKRSAE